MNRKELPREKKLKLRIGALEDKIIDLQVTNENQEANIKYLSDELKTQEDRLSEALSTINNQDNIIREYKKEFLRSRKLIDFLIDSKL